MNAYRQKKIAMVNDLFGYDRRSLIVAIPILPAMKVQCCPIPTSILSNHTGFPVYFFDDHTEKMGEFIHKQRELELTFNDIVNGFLGSEAQIKTVTDAIRQFRREDVKVIIDPVMRDHGETYATCIPAMCNRTKELVPMGNIVTPNLTEACILTGQTYRGDGWSRKELGELAGEIQAMGSECVVIVSVNQGGFIMNTMAESERTAFPKARRADHKRPGIEDIFSSVVSAAAARGWNLNSAVRPAASFVKTYIAGSEELDVPIANGVCLEELVDVLVRAMDSRHKTGKLTECADSSDDQGRPEDAEKR